MKLMGLKSGPAGTSSKNSIVPSLAGSGVQKLTFFPLTSERTAGHPPYTEVGFTLDSARIPAAPQTGSSRLATPGGGR